MKKLLFSAFVTASTIVDAQPVVYFDFVTHNEETSQWNSSVFYNANRTKLVALANYFQPRGITWNMQNDWVYLTNVLTKETPTLKMSTANKNILVWMHDDKGVEIDPHAHETIYTYPDVAKLMDSIGLPESKIIGGSIYNDSNGINIWTNLINGQYGNVFPSHFWKPDYMMGGGTPNHVADIKYYGIWNPQGPASFTTHDTSQRLRQLGVGCSIKIQTDTDFNYVMSQVHELMQNVQSGAYPASGHYLQTIFFEMAELNDSNFYNTVTRVADSVNAIVATGKAQWKTLKQSYTIWETTYGAHAFQWDCGQIATGVPTTPSGNAVSVYPNPSHGIVNIEGADLAGADLSLYDNLGRVAYRTVLQSTNQQVALKLPAGLYYYHLLKEGMILGNGSLIIME